MVVNAGARLDRLPISAFHWRILFLIGAGMILDGFEIYLQGGVLGALLKSGWSDLALNSRFISASFVGMVIGAWFAGILGDHFGRRFSYQMNLLIFGIASLAGAAAPDMHWLIAFRFVMGIGLGAEIVVGYAAMSEFVPPAARGRWIAGLSIFTNGALFLSALVGYIVIPTIGWRWMFIIAGVGALIVWYLRKNMPESPRWLESKGRTEEAERVMAAIEAEVSRNHVLPPVTTVAEPPRPGSKLPPLSAIFSRRLVMRTVVASVIAIAINTAVYGFIAWLPTFFVKQGMSIGSSLGFTTLMSLGGPFGALVAMLVADRFGRKPVVIGASVVAIVLGMLYPYVAEPVLFVLIGFVLVSAVYVIIGVGFALYIPELYPTDLRMRGNGFCNTLGRAMAMVVPFIIVPLFNAYGVSGVTGFVSAVLLVAALVVAIFGTETRQKSLEALVPDQAGDAVGDTGQASLPRGVA